MYRRACILLLAIAAQAGAIEPSSEARKLADKALAAIGGVDKVLDKLEFDEAFKLGANDRISKRHSVIEGHENWWLPNGKNRKNDAPPEPARYLVWAWTLGILTDPHSKLEALPPITAKEAPLDGLRVTGSVEPSMEIYFDEKTSLLARIVWRGSIYEFSEHQEVAGTKLAMKCIATKTNGAPFVDWDGSNVKRLDAIPEKLLSGKNAAPATKAEKK